MKEKIIPILDRDRKSIEQSLTFVYQKLTEHPEEADYQEIKADYEAALIKYHILFTKAAND